ncbi:hypothetical protein MMC06_004191 [Schaereria dolodes]|nr:hypothetical protein [Schaereria dolodes]
MLPMKDRRNSKYAASVQKQQPTPPTQDELSEDTSMAEEDDSMEKDETELELEKLIFGDSAGFQEGLKLYRQEDIELDSPDDEESEAGDDGAGDKEENVEQGLETVDDADLFFLDSGPGTTNNDDLLLAPASDKGEDEEQGGDPPAWVDSDDERITVSLASNHRLRKLRLTESEDLINGKEYTKRLRRQFERLYPVPEWANPSASKAKAVKKKRRKYTAADDSSSNDESASDMSVDSDSLSSQPLAQLLRNTNSLTVTPSTSTTRKKLRPEVIDIQRTKDVGGAQPSAITSLSFHPTLPLLLSSGPSSLLSLYHISPNTPLPNPLFTSLSIPHHPLTTSLIHPTSPPTKIFFSSRRRYFHVWDLTTGHVQKISRIYGQQDSQRSMERFKLSPCGRWMGLVGSGMKGGGVVNVLDAGTCQWVAQVRVEGKGGVADFEWWADGEGIVVIGKGGEAVEWSLREGKVLARWTDEGAVGTTVVALGGKIHAKKVGLLGGGDRWVAVGSQSGIVNVYERGAWMREGGLPERPKPVRSFDQLTTPTSHLVFSGDGQLLLMASRWKRDALRLSDSSPLVHRVSKLANFVDAVWEDQFRGIFTDFGNVGCGQRARENPIVGD